MWLRACRVKGAVVDRGVLYRHYTVPNIIKRRSRNVTVVDRAPADLDVRVPLLVISLLEVGLNIGILNDATIVYLEIALAGRVVSSAVSSSNGHC
jgi:hypothetical protein